MLGRPSSSTAVAQTVAVALAVVAALVLCALALTRDTDPLARDRAQAAGASVSTSAPSPSDAVPSSSGEPVPASPTATADPSADPPPAVEDLFRIDFGEVDALPQGTETYDNASVGEPMGVVGGLLQHGDPRGPVAVSSLETRLGSDVRKLGVRARFAPGPSGSVVLAAWQTSLVASRRAGAPLPATGMRLVLSEGAWSLTVLPGDEVLTSGTYAGVSGAASFEVVRQGDTLSVTDPLGQVTTVSDERVARLAGPWASWQLLEQAPGEVPAQIEEVWAG